MDPSGSGGVPSGADGDPLPEKGASGNPVERQHGLHDIRRGGEPLQEASHKGGTQKGGSVPEPDFPGPEEEWLTTPGGQFETAQSPAGEKEIQDGRGKDNQGPSETGGLDGVHRPQGCISFSPNSPQPPAIPEVLLERSDIRVSMPCIRAQQCSQGVHKAIKASGSTPEKERNPLHDLSGRHASDGPRREGAKEPDPGDSFPLPAVGLPDQSREVSPDPFSDNPLLGVHSGLKKVDAVPSRGEDRSNSECLRDSDAQSPGVSTRAGKTHRENVSSYAGYPSSPIMLSGAASSEDQILGCIPELRDRSGPGQSIIGRAEVVDDRSEEMERTFHSAPTARPHHRDRRISSGMGSCFRQEQHRGSVVRGREDSAYQPAGVDRGSICNSGFHEGSEKYSHSVEDGQHNGDIVHQSHGRYEISGPLTCSLRAMAVVPSERDHHHSGAPTGGLQCGSRSRVPHPEVNRMDVGRQGVQKNSLSPGAAHDRFICLPAEQPAGEVCQLAARSICSANRRLSDVVEGGDRICLPPFQSDWQMPPEGVAGGLHGDSSCADMGNTALVPSTPGDAGGISSTVTNIRVSTEGSIQQGSPLTGKKAVAVSRLESLRRHQVTGGISGKASRLLLSGWSKGTNATYQSGWSKWAGWCDSREIDPISCNVKYFLDFLTDLFEQGMQHRSINTIRSAVSMTHDNIEGIPIGQHPLVTRLLRGVHNLRPPKPRYEHTWDVDVVTKHIVKMGSNEDLSLKQLSQKLAVLMALVEASRTSELRALDLRFRVYKPDGVQFRLASLTKKRTPGAPPKVLFFGAFPEEERLCVMKCLHHYEKVTSEFRLEGGDDQPLFLSYTKPHKPVTAQRIAHWIKDLLAEAGVDTKVFKAHSVRGASTSAAMAKGVSISDILQTADWSRESTFKRFYYRTTGSNEFARRILKSSHN